MRSESKVAANDVAHLICQQQSAVPLPLKWKMRKADRDTLCRRGKKVTGASDSIGATVWWINILPDDKAWEGTHSLIRTPGIPKRSIFVVFHQLGAPRSEVFSLSVSWLTRSLTSASTNDIVDISLAKGKMTIDLVLTLEVALYIRTVEETQTLLCEEIPRVSW